MIVRTIQCGVCGKEEREKVENGGWTGWGQLGGIKLNGGDNPHLCQEHLTAVANFVDSIVVKK